MTDNIKDLPTDNYPITSQEKQIVEQFFNPVKEESYDFNQFKIPVIVTLLIIILNFNLIEDQLIKFFGDKYNYIKAILVGFFIYLIIKFN